MLKSPLLLLALLILAVVAACGSSDDGTPETITPAETDDSAISLTPTPTPTPIPATAETGLTPQEESNSPRPGDEVFNLCQSHYGNYHYNSPDVLLIDWTIDAYTTQQREAWWRMATDWSIEGADGKVEAMMTDMAGGRGPHSFTVGRQDTLNRAKAAGFCKWLSGICKDIDLFWQGKSG